MNQPGNFLVFLLFTGSIYDCSGDPAKDQLQTWKLHHPFQDRCTDFNGIPYPSLTASQAIGTSGPVLMQDRSLLERTASFNRERIPERVVHAKGVGAHGTFTVTHDISRWTKAKFLNKIGKKTPVFVRFSVTSGENGWPDTLRDARGFAVKFKTEDGNFDITGNQIEVFNIRDPTLFEDVNRSRKRNPQTHLKDPVMFWDFIQLRPETTHHILKVFADATTPESMRMINGSGVHTFQLVNGKGEAVFCKFHFLSHQPFQLMDEERQVHLAGTDPSWYFRDMYNAIETGQFPRWTFAVQIMTAEQAKNYRWDFLDITKNWREEDFPMYPIGILELNRNVVNQFAENEQSAFSPANLVPGIEPSADRMLHARMLSYPDAQRYRLGINLNQLPINAPVNKVASYERDGKMCFGDNGGGGPNYFPNSFNGPYVDPAAAQKAFFVEGEVARFDTGADDNFSQATLYVNKDITKEERQRIATRIGHFLAEVSSASIRELVFKNNFMPVDVEFTKQIRAAMEWKLAHPTPPIPERPVSL